MIARYSRPAMTAIWEAQAYGRARGFAFGVSAGRLE